MDEKNILSWKGWWKLLNIDQWGVFYFGAMIGMFLLLKVLGIKF
ncbi:MAG: hypothetical protein AABY92_09900 [Thermodesulfobacteriota bacterium]